MLHLAAFFIVLACVHTLNRPQSNTNPQPVLNSPPAQSKAVDHNAHLIGTPLGSSSTLFMINYIESALIQMLIAPLNHHEQIRLESVSAEYGNASLWFGEPTYESDRAWNKLIYREPPHHPSYSLITQLFDQCMQWQYLR